MAHRMGHERIGEVRTSMRRALYWPEIEMYLIRDDSELNKNNNAQRQSPMPITNNWRHFRPTFIFAGHYL